VREVGGSVLPGGLVSRMLVRGMRWDEQTILRSFGPWSTLALISVLEVVLDILPYVWERSSEFAV